MCRRVRIEPARQARACMPRVHASSLAALQGMYVACMWVPCKDEHFYVHSGVAQAQSGTPPPPVAARPPLDEAQYARRGRCTSMAACSRRHRMQVDQHAYIDKLPATGTPVACVPHSTAAAP